MTQQFWLGAAAGASPWALYALSRVVPNYRGHDRKQRKCACGHEVFFSREFVAYRTHAHTQTRCGMFSLITSYSGDGVEIIFPDGASVCIKSR